MARGDIVEADDDGVQRAASLLRAGGLVAVPTETVYGLAADASSPTAVRRIFAAKRRPTDHPLIVHLASAEALPHWAEQVPDVVDRLAAAFWPGPLTVVLPAAASVNRVVTGGRDTVAVRVPAHPVMQRLLAAFGGGLAAPSANRFGRVSPTTAGDVAADLGPVVDLILDGGPCTVGVESTIVEVVDADRPTVLRHGGVPAEALDEVLGRPVIREAAGPARAPGMLASHYAPAVPVVVHDDAEVAVAEVASLAAAGRQVGLLALADPGATDAHATWHAGGDVEAMARHLYRWLREADAAGLDVLVAVPPAATGLGAAVADRLRRAATR